MKAMIFAAGLGTRLKPITDTIPKALLPLGGKTLLQYQIEKLREAAITDIVINVHHFPDQIISYLEENHGFGCNIQISDERDFLLDTGGGLRKAASLLGTESSILACNVDILSNIDIQAFVASHHANSLATLVVSERDTQRYLLFNQENKMIGWTNISTGEFRPKEIALKAEESYCKLAFSGMQILSPRIFSLMDKVVKEKGDKFSLIDLYLSVCQSETIRAFIPQDYRMMDVGKIAQLREAEIFAESL